ncbi:MAG TPA: prepilin-type N-terminal cleavage/methylation domain-containing protein [Phycisphaeraceae bacterium]
MSYRLADRVRGPGLRGRGFTLIELLVVVAIIALLISILLPSLSKARNVARTVKCMAILKQFTTANNSYADAHENVYVPLKLAHNSAVDGGYQQWIANLLFRQYMGTLNGMGNGTKSSAAWPLEMFCPTMPEQYRGKIGRLHPMNNTGETPSGWTGPMIVRRAKVVSPTAKTQQFEGESWIGGKGGANYKTRWDIYGDTDRYTGGVCCDWSIYRHDEAMNILYFDGHAGRVTKHEAWDVASARNRLWEIYKNP